MFSCTQGNAMSQQLTIVTRNPNLELRPHVHVPDPSDPFVGPRPSSWWTGRPPTDVVHGLPMPNLRTCTRQQVLDYFDNGWTLTEVLFSALQGRQAFLTPVYHRLRHPLIFYYCHPAALYVNKLRVAGLTDAVNEDFETLFQTGV